MAQRNPLTLPDIYELENERAVLSVIVKTPKLQTYLQEIAEKVTSYFDEVVSLRLNVDRDMPYVITVDVLFDIDDYEDGRELLNKWWGFKEAWWRKKFADEYDFRISLHLDYVE